MAELLYLDASALVKLVVEEPESPALRERLGDAELFAADVASVELQRTVRRRSSDDEATTALVRARLRQVMLMRADPLLHQLAAELTPARLRTLDAIHLATAMRAGPELSAFVTYDERLAQAAREQGLTVESPGA